jgi:uncharacterized protein YcnI
VSADPGQAPAGAYQAVRFRVGHGCGKAATTALRIEIPEALSQARPQPKPGWTLTLERQGDRVSAIVWTGDLPADQFDEFAILAKLPDKPGPLYFPTVQTCETEDSQWTEIPDAGDGALDHPAPSVLVTPALGVAESHHH